MGHVACQGCCEPRIAIWKETVGRKGALREVAWLAQDIMRNLRILAE